MENWIWAQEAWGGRLSSPLSTPHTGQKHSQPLLPLAAELLPAQHAAAHTWPPCVQVGVKSGVEVPLQGSGCGLGPYIPMMEEE